MICSNCRKAGAFTALANSGATLPIVRNVSRDSAEQLHKACESFTGTHRVAKTRCDCQHKVEKVLRET